MFNTKHAKQRGFLSFFFSKKHLYKKTFALLTVFVLIGGTYFHTYTARGVDYTFTQTSWSGGQTVNVADHADNQTGWTQYNQKDTNLSFINGGEGAQLINSTNATQIDFTTEGDYIQQNANNTDFGASQVTLHSSGVSATGGTITYVDSNGLNPRTSPAYPSGYTVHKFTSSGTFTVANSGIVQVLVVAGGGGGKAPAYGGGGGGGGLIYQSSHSVGVGNIVVTVGAGGSGNGGNSVFNALTAVGGGAGGDYGAPGGAGGSGGGMSAAFSSVGMGTAGQGYNGGSGGYSGAYEGWLSTSGGGGGGAGGPGGNGGVSPFSAGAGGPGLYYSISGNSVAYSGGGGGAWYVDGGYGYGYAASGVGGGINNYGGGGTGGSGGPGIVIVRYPSSLTYPTTPSYITTHTNSQKNTSTWGAITNITATQITPTNTNIKYLVSFDNKSTWKYWNGSSWQTTDIADIATNGMTKTTIEALASAQWNATNGFTPGTFDIVASLSTSDASVTPSLDNIQITYTATQTQTLTSNIYNTQDTTTMLNHIAWSETLNANTDLKFQLRTSPDGTTWTNWCGPDDNVQGSCTTTAYFTDPMGGEAIDDIHRDKQGDQFIQYKSYLSTTDGLSTPALHDITVSYGTTELPTLTTQAVVTVTPTTATIQGTIITTGDENPTRLIQLGTQSNTYADECTAGTGAMGTYSCQITNLTPNTTYYYRAKATNAAGTSYGNEMSFTTLANTLVIPNPDTTKIENAVNDGYMAIASGTLTSMIQAQTVTEITMTTQNAQVIFPQNTQITGDGSFNFQNFTTQNITNTVRQDHPTSRAAIDLGIPGEQLSFSEDITMQIYVGTVFNDHQMEVLYQNDGESDWHHHTDCTVANGYCTFTTNHATIYTINGVHQATGDLPMNINVEVQETLSMDCFDISDSNTTVQIGTATDPGKVTAGTPAVGQSRCTVTTNADQGYYLTLVNDNTTTHPTLTHTDPNTSTIYEIEDLTQYATNTPNIQNWTAPTTKGLGFSVIHFPQTDISHNTLGNIWTETNACPEGTNPDTNDYAGIPETPQTITAVTAYQETATTTDICYKVDVLPSQPSGQYTGSVTFTATSDASGYYQ